MSSTLKVESARAVENVYSHIHPSVERVLSQLGTRCEATIFYYLSQWFGLKPEDLHSHPAEFHQSLRAILGKGSVILESMILQDLKSKGGMSTQERMFVIVLQESVAGHDAVEDPIRYWSPI